AIRCARTMSRRDVGLIDDPSPCRRSPSPRPSDLQTFDLRPPEAPMEVTLLGTGAPLAPGRATLGILVTAPGCAPLLIDTCGGFELARQLARAGQPLAGLRDVIVTHRHLDHAGGVPALLLANLPLDIHAT